MSDSVKFSKTLLAKFQQEVNPLIEKYFDVEIGSLLPDYPGVSQTVIETYKDITMRGAKRLRAALAYYAYEMLGGKKSKEALKMGVVLELVHAYLLILDDFMDQSKTRRHGPAAHVIFSNYYKEHKFSGGDSDHFGASIAVTIGAMGFHMAMQLLNSLDFDCSQLVKLSANLNEKIEITAQGQILDVVNAAAKNSSENEVMKMLEWKTGVYTFENPLQSGAIMAGATDSTLAKLSEYGIPAGIAFQIQDDILGVFGNSESTGKPVVDDLKEGKYTLLIHKTLEMSSKSQKEELLQMLGSGNITEKDLEVAKQIMVETGALDYARNKAHELISTAKSALSENFGEYKDTRGYKFIDGIADYIIDRKT